jgi:hypothetical protein
MDDLIELQVLVTYLRVRLARLKDDEAGFSTLEWVGIIIVVLGILATVTLVVRAKARAGANKIKIP